MKEVIQKRLVWAVILSESTHVFCCVFPTVFSVLSLLAGLGVVATMPGFMVEMHDFLHEWELPMIAASGAVLALGWAAVLYSDRLDCRTAETSCCDHESCAPKKNRAHLVLTLATVLFVFNVFIYLAFHKSTWLAERLGADPAAIGQQHEGHDHGHEESHQGHSH